MRYHDKLVFATSIHFYPRVIFAGKAGAYQREAPGAPSLARKYYTRVKMNRSRLLRCGNNYSRREIYNTGSWMNTQHNISIECPCAVSYYMFCWVSLYWMSLRWPLCWMPLWLMLLCWLSQCHVFSCEWRRYETNVWQASTTTTSSWFSWALYS